MDRTFLAEMFSSIAERSRNLLRRQDGAETRARGASAVLDLCAELLSGRGEASGVALALDVLDAYQALDAEGRRVFYAGLLQSYGPDSRKMTRAMDAWRATPTDATAAALHFASEPRRQELLRRLNRAPGGTAALVRMRADLIDLKGKYPELATVDRDFQHLLSSWFNRGFLSLRRIDWSTPANILEKIILYEAVHAIAGWDDLRRRIDPVDRRCYAFFHPTMLDEPLIFVEVALTQAPPGAIAPLLAQNRTHETLDKARTAAFYSISNCQHGLAGISFGNFLIKQVVEELKRDLPQIETFVTLSPVHGFMKWLKTHAVDLPEDDQALIGTLDDPGWPQTPALSERLRRTIEPLAAYYFLDGRTTGGRPVDPVARFHLGNGARLERLNWLGDRSDKALHDSAGLMVNYLYDPDEIEANHEAYANAGVTAASSAVKRLVRSELRQRLQIPVASSTQ